MEINILQLIPYGRENAISRADLQRLTGLNERSVRTETKRLLRLKNPILSSSKHKGYWLSDDPAEIRECINEFRSKGDAMYENAEILSEILASIG